MQTERFDGNLHISYSTSAKKYLREDMWRVQKSFRYFIDNAHTEWVIIPAGYLSDGASVPRPFWSIIPPWGSYGKAAVIHDFLCEYLTVHHQSGKREITRKEADEIFDDCMKLSGVSSFKRRTMRSAVHAYRTIFGIEGPVFNESKLVLEAKWRADMGRGLDVED